MDKRKKSAKNDNSKSDDVKVTSPLPSDGDGLETSLDALVKISKEVSDQTEGEVVRLLSGKQREQGRAAGSAKELVEELDEKYSNSSERLAKKGSKTFTGPKEIQPEALGVVELLGALKSDIDSLRQDNEAFKTELMERSDDRDAANSANSDVRVVLEALKADIGHLRDENDDLRSRALPNGSGSAKAEEAIDRSADLELYSMLAELKDDIVSLRSENEALRQGNMAPSAGRPRKKKDEVAEILYELKSDLNELKHENESMRLENLTARDGARFDHLGSQTDAYRNTRSDAILGLVKGLGALVLVAGAAGGGYYLAKSQDGTESGVRRTSTFEAKPGYAYRPVEPAQPLARVEKPLVKVQRDSTPKRTERAATPFVTTAPIPKAARRPPAISSDVEAAMITRADGLLSTRDLGAARMVFVYLARHGSGSAMFRLAQTYDPQYLGTQRFDAAKNGDLTRAARLYDAASNMGNTDAMRRLQELR